MNVGSRPRSALGFTPRAVYRSMDFDMYNVTWPPSQCHAEQSHRCKNSPVLHPLSLLPSPEPLAATEHVRFREELPSRPRRPHGPHSRQLRHTQRAAVSGTLAFLPGRGASESPSTASLSHAQLPTSQRKESSRTGPHLPPFRSITASPANRLVSVTPLPPPLPPTWAGLLLGLSHQHTEEPTARTLPPGTPSAYRRVPSGYLLFSFTSDFLKAWSRLVTSLS